MSQRTAVLLDEQPIWLDALERVLTGLGFSGVEKTTIANRALTTITERRPELFVLDTDLSGSIPDGLTCLREALVRVPTMKAIVISNSNDPERIESALGAGAVAYVLKRAEPQDVALAIRQVFSRSMYLAGGHPVSRGAMSAAASDAGLTKREREILQLVAEGNTNGQVARTLWVTEQTVKFHLANIFRKLNVSNRTQASRWAHTHGVLTREEESEEMPALAVS